MNFKQIKSMNEEKLEVHKLECLDDIQETIAKTLIHIKYLLIEIRDKLK